MMFYYGFKISRFNSVMHIEVRIEQQKTQNEKERAQHYYKYMNNIPHHL